PACSSLDHRPRLTIRRSRRPWPLTGTDALHWTQPTCETRGWCGTAASDRIGPMHAATYRPSLAAMVVAVSLFGVSCTSGHVAATYRNPVFHHDAPDPSIIRAPNGTYYAYTTQSIYLRLVNIPVLRSS